MKSFLSVIAVAVASLIIGGCSAKSSLTAPNSHAAAKKIHFSVDFNSPTALAKTATIGDGLTIAERQSLITHLKARATILQFNIMKLGTDPFPPTYSYSFPIVNGYCDGYMDADSGDYRIQCYTMGEIKVGQDSMVAEDFQTIANYYIDEDTTKISVILQLNSNLAFGLLIKDSGVTFNGKIDSLLSFNLGVVGGYAGTPTAVNGYVNNVDFQAVKKTLSFIYGGKKYSGLFDITAGFDSNIVVLSVNEVKQPVINPIVAFATDIPMFVDSTYPSYGATNVPTNINAVAIYFNKPIGEEPSTVIKFTVVSSDGSQQLAGTMGESDNFVSRNLDDGVSRVYFKPNTVYTVTISGVIDEFGNAMVAPYSYSFTTGN